MPILENPGEDQWFFSEALRVRAARKESRKSPLREPLYGSCLQAGQLIGEARSKK